MTTKTEFLTADEIAKIDSIKIYNPLQKALLDARKRTGLRLNTGVKVGCYFVQVLSFQIGAKGKPVGVATARDLACFEVRDVDSAIRFIEAL